VSQRHDDVPVTAPRDSASEQLDELIAAMALGDHGAFDQVFRELSGPVYSMALTVIHDAAQAEEITQEVLLEMWFVAGRYDPAKGSAVGWALMIARRRAIDRIRSTSAGLNRERQSTVTAVPWDQVHEAAEANLDREHLRHCLGKLSGPQREAITLAFYGGYTYADVAAILGVAVGTVKSRIRQALISLRGCMQAAP
jgi:RNA polymerase sigma-70 factor, ECF subfamily